MKPDTFNPKSNRGRRQTAEPASSVRVEQMREAQRNHRERKRRYLEELEARAATAEAATSRVRELESQLQILLLSQSLANNNCWTCSHGDLTRSSSSFDVGPKKFFDVTRGEAGLPIVHSNSGNSFVPACELFQTFEIKFFEQMIRSIRSLATSTALVSRFVSLTEALMKCGDPDILRDTLCAIIKTVYAMLDHCSIVDRVKFIDAIALLMISNREIHSYLSRKWTSPAFQSTADKLLVRPLKLSTQDDLLIVKAMKSVQGIDLIEANYLIDELGNIFHSMHAGINQKVLFIRWVEIFHVFTERCTFNELSQLLTAAEISRKSYSNYNEIVLTNVLACDSEWDN
ncbi:hypothetical protein HDU84_009730 [Entophlyctis sp. JEL0112]|nr:hypothetical protein HDU84_009730 [Entophlyctis sp. JEL0112]